jgi:hypothetical protein
MARRRIVCPCVLATTRELSCLVYGGSANGLVTFPGYVDESEGSHYNVIFADSYTFGPNYTNEFRFSYESPDAKLATTRPGSVPLALTLPAITITNAAAPGLRMNDRKRKSTI